MRPHNISLGWTSSRRNMVCEGSIWEPRRSKTLSVQLWGWRCELGWCLNLKKVLCFEWSSPCYLMFFLAFCLVYLLPLFLALVEVRWCPVRSGTPWLRFYLVYLLAYLLAFFPAYFLTFFLVYFLALYLAYLLAFLLAFYLAYLLAFYLANLLAFYPAHLLAFSLAYLLAFYLAFYLACVRAYLLAF